ncbi:DUF6233 domain-containing protein [Streptomyces sp. NBC_01185]|uniref:DUF6233 domain-containing protein n=1 Tax=Streptomyces sp. NBC_01185 TaxID=2903764 RepID=UPI003864701D|nr:DUF6233 domain-containing protein [Streptomyces sp. NBC_01185]
MSFKIQPQRSSSTALLHRGGCATYPDQVGLISREDAMVALMQPDSSRARSADGGRTTGLSQRRRSPAPTAQSAADLRW